MKTRTLLLLALACGLLIMVAGAALLFQLSARDEVDPPLAVGERAVVADMTVTVAEVVEHPESLDVTVDIGGVDDADGAAGFRLIAGGQALLPMAVADDGCAATSVAPQRCIVRFDTGAAEGASRVLFFERGGERARWLLA